jgi:predicted ABC-type ATPase
MVLKQSTGADVCPGDHVFYHGPDGPCAGKVVTCGRHGFTARCGDAEHQVQWKKYLGHKQRRRHKLILLDHGEDGALAKNEKGKAVYLHGYQEPVHKAILFFKAPVGNRPGLVLTPVTDRRGHQTRRWKRTMKDAGKERRRGEGDKPSGAGRGYGTQHFEHGDTVHFEHDGRRHKGRITKLSKRHAHVETEGGETHRVAFDRIRAPAKSERADAKGKRQGAGKEKPAAKQAGKPAGPGNETGNEKGAGSFVAPEQFSAATHFSRFDEADISADRILDEFGSGVREKARDAQERLASIEETITQYRQDGEYLAERAALHKKILLGAADRDEAGNVKHDGLLSPERARAAKPAAGEKPTFILLGGRGGSGKSKFRGLVYDPAKAIVLDNDAIKSQLPEYAGWNAQQVHEEASDIFDRATNLAMKKKLNIVHDATMKTPEKARQLVQRFRDAGYRIEMHYMHLPRAEAARRAVQRFVGKTARYVPPEVILANRQNEQVFDELRPLADEWSFWDNQGAKAADDPPRLISRKSGGDDRSQMEQEFRDFERPENRRDIEAERERSKRVVAAARQTFAERTKGMFHKSLPALVLFSHE